MPETGVRKEQKFCNFCNGFLNLEETINQILFDTETFFRFFWTEAFFQKSCAVPINPKGITVHRQAFCCFLWNPGHEN